MIIGIIGLKGAGKTTLATQLITKAYFVRLGFAAPLKGMILSLLLEQGMTGKRAYNIMNDPELKEAPTPYLCGRSPRHAMQTLGTEWGRDLIHPDLWIEAWRRRVTRQTDVVADDLRFPNEAEAIHSFGGIVIRVERSEIDVVDLHTSEADQVHIPHDFLIENDGSVEDLWTQAKKILIKVEPLRFSKKFPETAEETER